MKNHSYEDAALAYQTIQNNFSQWWIRRMIKVPYVQMLVAQENLDAAMDIIAQGDTWIFSYTLVQKDARFAPLRKTERFKAFVKKHFPEKVKSY
jgi:hypothetical protein